MSVNSFKVSQELYELMSFIEHTANKTHKRRVNRYTITLEMNEFEHIKDKVEEIYQLSKPVFVTYDDNQTKDRIVIMNEDIFYTMGELKAVKDKPSDRIRDLK